MWTGIHAILESLRDSIPPPRCKKLSHVRIDQCEEDENSERNIDAKSWNWTAPSSSRSTVSSCRNNLITNFDTSKRLLSNLPGSKSAHSRSWYGTGIVVEDNIEFGVCSGLASATDVLDVSVFRKPRHVFVYPVHDPHPRTNSIAKWTADHDLDSAAALMITDGYGTGPIFVFPRFHPFTWDDLSLRNNVNSRHEPFTLPNPAYIKCRKVLSLLHNSRETCIGTQLGKFDMNLKISELLLIIAQQISLYSLIGRRVWFLSAILLALPWSPNRSVTRVTPYPLNIWRFLPS